ncbi:hypothetical protein ACCT21_35595, partial [Rhizobium brockwellii]
AVKVLHADGKTIEPGRISKILAFRGIERTAIDEAHQGDSIAIAGLSKGTVADTFCDPSITIPLPCARCRGRRGSWKYGRFRSSC